MIYDFSDIIKFPDPRPTPDAPLEEHLLFLKKHLFDKPYPDGAKRGVHDIKHATRALLHTKSILAILKDLNIGEEFTILLNNNLFYKSLLISIYLHDSGREGDGTDEWELDSGMTVYNYLTQIMGLSKAKAKKFAEAVVNKDFKRNESYFILEEKSDGTLDWNEVPLAVIESKPEFQETLKMALLVEYGDCIDIHRTLTEEVFDNKFLDIYTLYAKHFEELLPLILKEERRLLELMGDGPTTINPELQAYYQTDEFLERTIILISQHCPTLAHYSLSAPFDLTHYLPEAGIASTITALSSFQEYMDKGELLFRGVVAGPAKYAHPRDGEIGRTLAEIEISKDLSPEKNPHRSTSILGNGGTVFSSVGGIIKGRPPLDQLTSISGADAGTGFQTKMNIEPLSWFEKQKLWDSLQRDIRFGKGVGKVSEIELTIDHFDAIGYTFDPTVHENFSKQKSPVHPHTAKLKAIYIHQEYVKQSKQPPIPFCRFSPLQHYCVEETYSDEEIIQLWQEACRYWITHELKDCRHYDINLWNLSVEELKIYITFNARKMQLLTGAGKVIHQSPDLNYSNELKEKVNCAVLAVRNQIFKEHCDERKIQAVILSLAQKSDEYFNARFWNAGNKIHKLILRLRTYNLLESHKERILRLIDQYFTNVQLYENSFIFQIFALKNYLFNTINLYQLAMAWSANNNPVLKYIRSNVIPLYDQEIESAKNAPYAQKNKISDLLQLAAESNDRELVKEIYTRYYSIMSVPSSNKPCEIRECEQFHEFCKYARQLTAENLAVYKRMLANISFREPHDSDLTGSINSIILPFQIEYDNIFLVYIDRGFIDLAREKLSELLKAGHKNIQLRPLNMLLSYCCNRNVLFNLDDLKTTLLQVSPTTIKLVPRKGVQSFPLLLSHFLKFLTNSEIMSNQQYSEVQLSAIRKKMEDIVSTHPLEQWDLQEIEKCLDINAKKDFLGRDLTRLLEKQKTEFLSASTVSNKVSYKLVLTSTSFFITDMVTRSVLKQPTKVPNITVDTQEVETTLSVTNTSSVNSITINYGQRH